MPAARSPAQIEAARRNGAKSRGPITAEGRARSSMNALRHGMAARGHLLTEGEDPAAWDELMAGLVEEHEPTTETEARLVLRLASALWRQDRADRMEQAMFVAAPRPQFYVGGKVEHAAPEETFELARLDAIRRYRADASREVSRLIRELRQPRAEAHRAPERSPQNEPDPPAASPAARPSEGRSAPDLPAANQNAPNEPEPDFTLEERMEIEAMLGSGDPALLIEAARRIGALDVVAEVVAGAGAAGR